MKMRTVLVIHPDVQISAKDLRALSASYVVLRCLPSEVTTLDVEPVVIDVALEMLSATGAFIEPKQWRSYLAGKLIDRVRAARSAT